MIRAALFSCGRGVHLEEGSLQIVFLTSFLGVLCGVGTGVALASALAAFWADRVSICRIYVQGYRLPRSGLE